MKKSIISKSPDNYIKINKNTYLYDLKSKLDQNYVQKNSLSVKKEDIKKFCERFSNIQLKKIVTHFHEFYKSY